MAYDLSIHELLVTTSLSVNFWPSLQHQEQTPSHGASLQSNSEVVGYSPNIHATVALEGTPCPVLAVLYAGSMAV